MAVANALTQTLHRIDWDASALHRDNLRAAPDVLQNQIHSHLLENKFLAHTI